MPCIKHAKKKYLARFKPVKVKTEITDFSYISEIELR